MVRISGLRYQGPLPKETITISVAEDEYVLDVPTLTSNYRCIYGEGCQGTSTRSDSPRNHTPEDNSVTGCCRTSVIFQMSDGQVEPDQLGVEDSPARIAKWVDLLEEDETQNWSQVQDGWYRDNYSEAHPNPEHPARVRTIKGNCIFLNTEMDNGKTGCALYHLAQRLDMDPALTRPIACSVVPSDLFEIGDTPEGGTRYLVTIRPHWFGWFSPDGYWCTKDPAAFSGTQAAYQTLEQEFRVRMGDTEYQEMKRALDQVMEERGERIKRSWGQPVELPMPKWARE